MTQNNDDIDQRLDEEIRFHIEQQTEKNVRAGMSPAEARRAAMVKFGGVESVREYTRDEFRWAVARDFARDVRIALRTLMRTPGFAVAVILTFALGIGAASSMFSVYDGVLLKPLPYPESERIVRLYQLSPKGSRGNVSEPNFLDWQRATHSFASMAEVAAWERPVSGMQEPTITTVAVVSREFFDVMGVWPSVGRGFLPDEQREGGDRVVVVSSAFWKRASADPTRPPGNDDILRIDNDSYTVVGVMPPGFDYPAGTSVWTVREQNPPQLSRTAHNFKAVARLKDGVSLASAQADISGVSRSLKTVYKDQTWMADATAIPILEAATGTSRRALDLLFVASLLLLVIASANVSNLMVARAASRKKEFAVQLSLGATRGRLARQALAEAMVLCVSGGALGVGLAAVAVRVFAALGPSSAPRLDTVSMNWTGVVFSLVLSSLAAMILSVITSAGQRHVNVAPALLESSRSGTGSRTQIRLRQGLIVTELALTLVLLVGTGLLAKSFQAVLAVNPGYRLDSALVADITAPRSADGGSRQVRFQDSLLERVRALPGVTAAGFINEFPLGDGGYSNGTLMEMFRVDEFTSYAATEAMSPGERLSRSASAGYRLVSPGYFRTMGIPLLRGRLIEETDGPGTPHVAVISESLVKAKWPDRDPLGRYVQFGNMDGNARGIRIVGIVGDVRELSPEILSQPILYASARQRPVKAHAFSLVVRGPAPGSISDSVRRIVRELDPEVPVRMATIEIALDAALGSRRFNLWLIGAFSVAAFALAALGVYGLVAFTVTQRVREIGIRMALGAEEGALVGLIVKGGLKLASLGVVAGLVVAMGLMNLIEGLLFGVRPSDPFVVFGVVAATLITSVCAAWVPARRVVRIPPTESLREA